MFLSFYKVENEEGKINRNIISVIQIYVDCMYMCIKKFLAPNFHHCYSTGGTGVKQGHWWENGDVMLLNRN